jgi:2-keto-4-pentenoate hydratase/2-oxohepta-3-ene-1,7-dioic acid hydratase in catechol pathway
VDASPLPGRISNTDLGAFLLHLTATGIQPPTINARPKFLKPGDVVKLWIENIRTLTNRIS